MPFGLSALASSPLLLCQRQGKREDSNREVTIFLVLGFKKLFGQVLRLQGFCRLGHTILRNEVKVSGLVLSW